MTITGVCVECGEATEPEDSCCGAGVWVEGTVVYPKDDEQ